MPASAPKPADAASPPPKSRRRELTDAWDADYLARHGRRYAWQTQSAADGKKLTALLADFPSISIADFRQGWTAMWESGDEVLVGGGSTLRGFAALYPQWLDRQASVPSQNGHAPPAKESMVDRLLREAGRVVE